MEKYILYKNRKIVAFEVYTFQAISSQNWKSIYFKKNEKLLRLKYILPKQYHHKGGKVYTSEKYIFWGFKVYTFVTFFKVYTLKKKTRYILLMLFHAF